MNLHVGWINFRFLLISSLSQDKCYLNPVYIYIYLCQCRTHMFSQSTICRKLQIPSCWCKFDTNSITSLLHIVVKWLIEELPFQSINWWWNLVRFAFFTLVNLGNTLYEWASITTSLHQDQTSGIVVAILLILLRNYEQTYPKKFELCVCVQLWEIVRVPHMKSSISTLQCCTLCYSIMSHATLILYYHTSMLTLHTSLISHALWLPHAWY